MPIAGLESNDAIGSIASDLSSTVDFTAFQETMSDAAALQIGVSAENAKAQSLMALAQKVSDTFSKLR